MYTLIFLVHFFSLSYTSHAETTMAKAEILVRNSEGKMENVYETLDSKQIKELKSCLNGRTAPNFKCGYTGKIIFTEEDGSTSNAEFNIKSCNHIVFIKGNRLISRYLKQSSIDLLNKLTKQ